ncbi:hypothetical protein NM680_01665 [Paracoccus sp. PS-1]|uniref:hypothetical protein n=1 Tax=unclassified Paracoccus (in: a-proteobacteria) TaxID=2688777 RepID=UPI00048D06A4|nr:MULTISPECIES: hypothetical protein [unclassified Paracoccus (in: a-proteobacteria)]MDQ7260501.1 hypothetical protein [Paracoccus sp. PS1]
MERAECNRNCWISAAIAGVVVLLFTSGIGDLHWLAGLFLGAVTFVLFGALMVWLVCHERPELFAEGDGLTGTDWQRAAVDRQPETLLVGGSLGPEPFTSGTQMSGRQMPIVAGAMPAAASRPDPAPAAPAQPAGTAPGTDDLKRIKGIGPKISDWLNAQGVTRYEQIAAWDAAAVADFAQRLGRMGGRIEADDWVGQAKLLAAGGETAHSRRIDKGEAV